MTKCEVNNCRKEPALTWLGHVICNDHWSMHCNDKFDLYKEFGIAKPKMSSQLKEEVEKTEKIRKIVDQKVTENIAKAEKINKEKENQPKKIIHRTGSVIKNIKTEFAAGNFNVQDIVTKTGANPSTVKTQHYRWKKENQTATEVATNGKEEK